jgi:hypothetical protein
MRVDPYLLPTLLLLLLLLVMEMHYLAKHFVPIVLVLLQLLLLVDQVISVLLEYCF